MKLKLNDKISIDLPTLIESRLLVQANSGGGKSWAIRRIIEQAFGHVQIIVIDPEGEFGNMRSKYDFVYVGKDGDAPAESRSAALLAHRLLELKASAVIDLYELAPQERKHFVRLFCESMVNSPKELWHDVLVIIDEAHVFAPEKDQSEALTAVVDLMSRGRKRGYCGVLATQRPAKLNKDAAAECNNKLIGRATLDIDRKRAAEELGFTDKDAVRSLRDLDPGEFYVFGTAISREVVKTQIGDVKVKPAKRGVSKRSVPAPSSAVKKMLAKFKDLPQAAAEELKTINEFKNALTLAKRRITELERAPKDAPVVNTDLIERAAKNTREKYEKEMERFKKSLYNRLLKSHGYITDAAELLKSIEVELHPAFPALKEAMDAVVKNPKILDMPARVPNTTRYNPAWEKIAKLKIMPEGQVNKGELLILQAIAGDSEGITTEHIAVLTGYKGTSRRVYLGKLAANGLVAKQGNVYKATEEGIAALGSNYKPLPQGADLRDYWLANLPEGERKIFSVIVDAQRSITSQEIQEATGYKPTSVRVYLGKLKARKLIVNFDNGVALSDKLL